MEVVAEVKVKMGDKEETEGVRVRLLYIMIIILFIHAPTFKRAPPIFVDVLFSRSQRSRER